MSISTVLENSRLAEALAADSKIVYLCGAGASMSLGNHRLSWANWLISGKDYLSPADRSEFERRIGSWSANELIDAATFLLDKLKGGGKYEAFMDATIGSLHPQNKEFEQALRGIWRAGDLIATTNYDLQIEEAVSAAPISYSSPADILSIILGEDNKVIHLHGVYDKMSGIDDIIADDPQYKGILENAGAQFIQNLISTNTIIIVGCGGTVEDPNLSGFMRFVVDKLGAKDIPYFYLMKSGDAVPDLPSNTLPMYYGEDYADLPTFLLEMSMLRLRKRAGLRNLVSIDPYAERASAVTAFGRMHFSNEFNDFVGRKEEIRKLNGFLEKDARISCRSVIGEGGAGKSRLVFEWLKHADPRWFGFFAKKNPNEARAFVPFTDTVIVFDYVLGKEKESAETIKAFFEAFRSSAYKLRILLIERERQNTDWIKEIKRWFSAENRLEFETAYDVDPIRLTALSADDEKAYIRNYLSAYLPLLKPNAFIEECKANIDGICATIEAAFRESVEPDCYRPLYLSIFTEVWIGKEGKISLSSAQELMEEYLNKETDRWKTILGDESLTDSYLRLLAMACAVEYFNITDVYGDNYLEKDCKSLIGYLDGKSGRPGGSNLFEELFISMDEAEESSGKMPVLDIFWRDDFQEDDENTEWRKIIRSLEEDDRFAFSAPYIKLYADPVEFYLNMLVESGLAEDSEIERLDQVREANKEKVETLPDHAWIIEPMLPSIIKEYIVSYVINDRDVVRFTKLARSNSILGFENFLTLALDDFPSEAKFQKMIVTPPDEVINYFEYYLSLMTRIEETEDLRPVEQALIEVYPIFRKYEFELWKRIAHVLNDRGDIERLYDSGCRFIDYLKSLDGLVGIHDEAVDIIREYCVGLHNAEETEKFSAFLDGVMSIDRLFPKSKAFGTMFCEGCRLLMHLKLYHDLDADISGEWIRIMDILERYENSDETVMTAMEAADEYLQRIIEKEDIDKLCALESDLEKILGKHRCVEVAEIAARTTGNVFTIVEKTRHKILTDRYEKLKKYLSDYPHSMRIRSAYITVSREYYLESGKKAPDKLIKKAAKWAILYPEEIEFHEGYFGLLLSRLEYAQAHLGRDEQMRIFKEMKRTAERADYSEYDEENDLMNTIRTIQDMYGY